MAVDGGWGWMVVLGAFIVNFFLAGITRSLGVVFDLMKERFEASAAETSLAVSLFVASRTLGGPIGSKLSDKFGCRAVVMTGGLMICIGLALSAFATNLVHVCLAMGIVGGTGGMLVITPTYIMVSKWFDKKKGKAMAFTTVGNGLGGVCMAPLIALLLDQYYYFGTMLIVGSLFFNVSVGGALFRNPPLSPPVEDTRQLKEPTREQPIRTSTESDDNRIPPSTETETDTSSSHHNNASLQHRHRCTSWLRSSLWTNIPFVFNCITVTTAQACILAVLIFLPSRGKELGASDTSAAMLLVLFGVFDVAGRFLVGFIFDLSLIRRRRVLAYVAVAALFGAGTALVAAAGSYVMLAVIVCIVAMVEGGAHSQRATCVTELVEPSQTSLGIGVVIFAQGVGNFYGPLMGGALRDVTGSYLSVFIVSGSCLLVACILTAAVNIVLRLRHNVPT